MAPNPPVTDFLLDELEGRLAAEGSQRYRARQIVKWVYGRRARTFEVMTDLSLELRSALAERYRVLGTSIRRSHESPDRTVKLLVGLDDGRLIETVLIREGERKTVCVSTQVGCPVGCLFCASGLEGLARNLTTSEIVEQVLHVQGLLPEGDRVDNLVIMGIGEPLLNAGNLVRALRIWNAAWGLGIGYNRITLSTVGILPRLRDLIDAGATPNLALSLHAPNDEIRARIVPTMRKWTVADIIAAGVEYRRETGKEVTFEYVLLAGVNDEEVHARELGRKVRSTGCKVNVIPFNTVEETPFRAPSPERVDRFAGTLRSCGVGITVRRRKGDEISAACGQLRAAVENGREAPGRAVRLELE